MKNSDIILHVQGKTKYIDDMETPDSLLYLTVFTSNVAHAKIKKLDISKALELKGVQSIYTYKDIPGENEIGNIIMDEPLLAKDKVHFMGQPIAIVLADTKQIANKAIKLIDIEYKELTPIFDPKIAYQKGELIAPSRTFLLGDIDNTWDKCDFIVEEEVEVGGQEHLYLETQSSLAIPTENGVKLFSSTQSPTAVQKTVAKVLGISMHQVEVDVLRLGGAFGGKEDQATAWAALAALASFKLKKPVKLILNRKEDITYTGKRHPYKADYKIGLKNNGTILAYEANFYQNAGASADLSTAILERTLFHSTASYFIPNVKINASSCRTNLVPNTAFRGFGAPQAMFVLESAIYKAAEKMKKTVHEIQQKNLLKEDDIFPYGMKAKNCQAINCWNNLVDKYDFKSIQKDVDEFNSVNKFNKKGIAIMPLCFGISFTATFLNQATSLVHIYTDGSIGITTGAIEMGQGVNIKIAKVASQIFSISTDRIKLESTNTTRAANTSPTAASTGADINGQATKLACDIILTRMKNHIQQKIGVRSGHTTSLDKIEFRDENIFVDNKKIDLTWNDLVADMYLNRISLSAQAHYATPNIFFDKTKEKGDAFFYHSYGTALIEVTVDCIRGTYNIDSVKIVHDYGKSLDPVIDKGQTEGALVQGIGWITMEELVYSDKGKLLTDSMTTYKVPDIYSAPKDIQIHFLENADNPQGLFKSKAIGEPPFMYGIATYFAILNAIKEFKPDIKVKYNAPITPEKLLMMIYS